MSKSNLLIVLAPRELPEEHASLRALPVDQVWCRAMTEVELVPAIAGIVERSKHRNILVVADDVIATPEAYARVAALLEVVRVATDWCPMMAGAERANLSKMPGAGGDHPTGPWYRCEEVRGASAASGARVEGRGRGREKGRKGRQGRKELPFRWCGLGLWGGR